ncbi:hypothetical protein [Ralstonia soli]|uniref:ATP-binding protein n=1 Tax=Ralstonia soli TaxID=2953896 RepID=A0ABT1AHV8_9RALS|nr:hypothetical protein [Ralstonia soli]MCO5397879.1 hypothetical protein [Ralstonia soli]
MNSSTTHLTRPAQPDALLPNELTRRQLMLDHPLIRGIPVLTPPIERAATACKVTFFEGSHAFTLIGPPGCGRRSAVFLVLQALQSAVPTLTVLQHTFGRCTNLPFQEEWRSLLMSLDPHAPRDSIAGLQNRCVLSAAHHVRRAGGNGAILLVLHHIERITDDGAKVLLDFADQLAARNFRLLFFSVAEQGDFAQHFGSALTFKLRELNALVGKLHVLDMIDPVQELPAVLREIDLAEFPVGCSWTQFFAPQAYTAGLRLEHCHAALSCAIGKMQGDFDLRPTTRQLFTVIRTVLGQAALHDRPGLQLEEGWWFDALYRTSFSCADRIQRLLPNAD